MLLNKKPPSPFKRALRNLQLGFSFGIAAFLLGIMLSSRLQMALLEVYAGIESELLLFLVSGVVRELPVLLVAPAIAYVAGLFFEGPRWTLAWSMVAGVQAFPIAIDVITEETDYLLDPARIGLLLAATVVGGVLCGLSYARGQKKAHERAAAPASEPEPGSLSKIDFEAVKKAAEEAEGSKDAEGSTVPQADAPSASASAESDPAAAGTAAEPTAPASDAVAAPAAPEGEAKPEAAPADEAGQKTGS